MSVRFKTIFLIGFFLLASGVFSFFMALKVAGLGDRIASGLDVRGLNLGGLTRDEATQALEQEADRLRDQIIGVHFNGGGGSFKLDEVNFRVDTRALLDKAWVVGRQGNLIQRWQDRKTAAREGLSLPYEFSFSEAKLLEALNRVTEGVRVPPRDADIIITPANTVEIIESQNGVGIDFQDAQGQMRKILADKDPGEIELKLISVPPDRTTEEIKAMKIDGQLAAFTTYFDVTKTNRVYNIRVAAAALDGQMIQPGEEFSFNKVVGPRSSEAGYKLAPTILNNEFIDSLGGGVCQVSTTLYNVLLLADLQVKERYNHSLAIAYVPLGQDAAVAYGGKDLVFINNLPSAVIIKALAVGNSITVRLFGDTSLHKRVRILNEVISEYPYKIVYQDDPTLDQGQEVVKQTGITGYRVKSTLQIFQGSNILESKELSPSYYKPVDQVVLVGTKPVTTEWPDNLTGQTNADVGADELPAAPEAR